MILVKGKYDFFHFRDLWGMPTKEFVFSVEDFVFVRDTGKTYRYNDGYREHDAKIYTDGTNEYRQVFNVGELVGYKDSNGNWWHPRRKGQRYVKAQKPFLFHDQL